MGRDIGKPCSGTAQCSFGCLGIGYCTAACSTGADCPNGWGCMAIPSGERVCVQAEAFCGGGELCAGAVCDTTMLAAGCSLHCTSSADCPHRAASLPAWNCSAGTCDRPADVFGPLPSGANAEYACNPASGAAVNLCNDGLTIHPGSTPPAVDCSGSATTSTPGAPGELCADTCTYQGGCTYGFACVATATLGANPGLVGVCLRAGAQPVGQPCTDHAQCNYAYCPTALGKCSRDCTPDGACPAGFTCKPTGQQVGGVPFRRCE